MNVKLQKLMDRSFTDHQGERFDPERFAQLIVQECVDICDKMYFDNYPADAEYFKRSEEGDAIRKHFGFEE